MSLEIEGRLYLKLTFAGVEFPFQRVNSVNFLHTAVSARIGVPTFHLSLNDPTGFFEKEGLIGDGIPLEVVVGPAPDAPIMHTFQFRLNNPTKKHSTPNTVYDIDGYLDVPAYWHASAKDPIEGTSSDVLQSIADSCGLTLDDGVQSDDFQVWWPGNRRYFQWAWDVCQHSYAADNACLQMGLETDKTLFRRDVNLLDEVDHQLSFMEPREGFILATDVQPFTRAGSSNHISGYRRAHVYQNLMKNDAELNVLDEEVEVEASGGEVSFLMNKNVRDQVSKAAVHFRPLDFGATHEKYERASYQNGRYASIFGTGIRVVTPEATEVKLFQNIELPINYPEDPAQPRYSEHLSGIHKIETHGVYVNGSNYYEHMTAIRRAYGSDTKEN